MWAVEFWAGGHSVSSMGGVVLVHMGFPLRNWHGLGTSKALNLGSEEVWNLACEWRLDGYLAALDGGT